MKFVDKKIVHYCREYSTKYSPNCGICFELSKERIDYTEMLSSPEEVFLMQQFIISGRYKNVLEVGTFTGMMTTGMAEVVPDGSSITTLDMNPKYAEVAKTVFKKCDLNHKINFIFQPAIRTIVDLKKERYDLIFIDADKDMYPVYYDLLLPKLKRGGIMILDNMLWKGGVLDPKERKAKTLHQLNEQIVKDSRVSNSLIPIGDGWNVVRRIH